MNGSVPRPGAETERAVAADAVGRAATNGPDPSAGSSTSGNDGSGDLSPSPAAERVAAWLAEFNTLGGLDNRVAHIANRTPLYVDDLWTLVRAVRVVVDDTTVDRVAVALLPLVALVHKSVEPDSDIADALARAAVRAVLGEDQP